MMAVLNTSILLLLEIIFVSINMHSFVLLSVYYYYNFQLKTLRIVSGFCSSIATKCIANASPI